MFCFQFSIRTRQNYQCIELYQLAVSKKKWSWIRLWAIFMDFCPWRATESGARCNSHNDIYDIGTEILYFQCFATTDMFCFTFLIWTRQNDQCIELYQLVVSKHDLKRSKKKVLDSLVGNFHGFLPPEGD